VDKKDLRGHQKTPKRFRRKRAIPNAGISAKNRQGALEGEVPGNRCPKGLKKTRARQRWVTLATLGFQTLPHKEVTHKREENLERGPG